MNKPPPPSAATIAYKDVGLQLQLGMGIAYTGNPDEDFAALMLVYDKGAAGLARIVLEHGKDPEIRQIAKQVLETEAARGAQLKAWQGAHP